MTGTYKACNKTLAIFIICLLTMGASTSVNFIANVTMLCCGIVNVSGSNMAVSLPFPGCHKDTRYLDGFWLRALAGWLADRVEILPPSSTCLSRISPGSDSQSAPTALFSLLHILYFRSLPCSFSLFRHTDNPDFPPLWCALLFPFPVGLHGCRVSHWVNWIF